MKKKYIHIHKYHHHHHVALVARISLTLSRHFSLSFIALGRSSGQHLVSSHSCWMYVCAGRPAFAQPCVGVHKSTSFMSSSLLLQQCPACLVCLTWIVFVIGGRWPYSWCLVGCCRQDLTQFLPGSGHIDTAIRVHYMDANKTAGEEARRQLHKNAMCNLEQVYTNILIYIYIYIYTYIHVCMCVCVYTHTCLRIYAYIWRHL